MMVYQTRTLPEFFKNNNGNRLLCKIFHWLYKEDIDKNMIIQVCVISDAAITENTLVSQTKLF